MKKRSEARFDFRGTKSPQQDRVVSFAKRLLTTAVNSKDGKQRGFDLTLDWLLPKLRTGTCELTGIPFEFPPKIYGQGNSPLQPSIDKINPQGGYTQKNCRVVLLTLNYAFNVWGSDRVLPILRDIGQRLAQPKGIE